MGYYTVVHTNIELTIASSGTGFPNGQTGYNSGICYWEFSGPIQLHTSCQSSAPKAGFLFSYKGMAS